MSSDDDDDGFDSPPPAKKMVHLPAMNKGFAMIQKMGFKEGSGLGKSEQGIVEPVSVSQRKGRKGLGATVSLTLTREDREFIESVAWKTAGQDDASEDGDIIWSWKQKRAADEEPDRFEQLLPGLEDTRLRGPTPLVEASQRFCDGRTVKAVVHFKSQIDGLQADLVLRGRSRSNPYELVKGGIFMNRAAMKMANMDAILDGLFSRLVEPTELLRFADVCAGPGGFSEYMLWRRCNGMRISEDVAVDLVMRERNPIPVQGFGFTLKGENDFRLKEFRAGPGEAFYAHYGHRSHNDGNIFKWENLAEFAAFVHTVTQGHGVHAFMADGGFDVSGQENQQEVKSKQIYLCQCLCALMILRPRGIFVTKLFDVFTEFSVSLIYLMSHVFREVRIVKPVSSRPANSERYLLCEDLIDFNAAARGKDGERFQPTDRMAGCPAFPKSGTQASSTKPAFETSNMPKRSNSISNKTSAKKARKEAVKAGELLPEVSSPLAKLIRHLIHANVLLNAKAQNSVTPVEGCIAGKCLEPLTSNSDLLWLCDPDLLMEDKSFVKFITTSNDEYAVRQCTALSKLIVFANDATLEETRQTAMKTQLLKKWKVPSMERQARSWPLWKTNMSPVLREIVNDTGPNETLRSLSAAFVQGHPSRNLQEFTRHDCDMNFHDGRHVAVIVPTTHMLNAQNSPFMIYSRGGSEFPNLYYSYDGGTWANFSDFELQCKFQIPAGTILYVAYTRFYLNHLRCFALTILDAVAVYGLDCRQLHYRQRMDMAAKMVAAVSFAATSTGSLRCAHLVSISRLGHFMDQLTLDRCKDNPEPVLLLTEGRVKTLPSSVYIVQHIREPWIERYSEERSGFLYYNTQTDEYLYTLDDSNGIPFEQTHFRRLEFKKTNNDDFDAHDLMKRFTGR